MSKAELRETVVASMVAHMLACRRQGVSFADCLADARVLFNREVNAEVNARLLPPK